MPRCQLFEALTLEGLQDKINNFIKDKKVISSSMCEIGTGNNGILTAMIIYEED